MNNSDIHVMKKCFNTVASAMVMFALVLSALTTPISVLLAQESQTQIGNVPSLESSLEFDNPKLDLGFGAEIDIENTLKLPDGFQNQTPVNFGDTSSSSFNSDGQANSSAGSNTITECFLNASSNQISTGSSVTLNWSTSGFDSWTLNGEAVFGETGSKTFSNVQENSTFVLSAIGKNGEKCKAEVEVKCLPPEVPKVCELQVAKSVNKTMALPGDEIEYTIVVKNIGDADCSGSGVIIEDKVDSNITYLSNTVTSNLSAGYTSRPVYTSSDRTLRFNGYVLNPGESGTIKWIGKIATPNKCGDFEVKNQAKATAEELNNFQIWAYSEIVKTAIDNDCEVPKVPVCTLTPVNQTVKYGETATLSWTTEHATAVTLSNFGTVALNGTKTTGALLADSSYKLTATGAGGKVECDAYVKVVRDNPLPPNCPLTAADGRTIVSFNNVKLRTDSSAGDATTLEQAVSLQPGTYDVTLASWDGYNERVSVSQPKEQWQLEFLGAGSVIAKSGVIGDLADNVREATKVEKVNTDLLLSSYVTGLRAVHPFYPYTVSANSLYPICAAIDEKSVGMATVVVHKIVCTDETQLPNYGNGGPNITPNTAPAWVASHDSCSFIEGWEFQWNNGNSTNPGDTLVGKAGTPWSTFGPTDSNGRASVEISIADLTKDETWFREVMKPGYILFTYGQNVATNVDPVSAEFYCDTDVINYDNMEHISNMKANKVYNCVAWNSPEPEIPAPTCDLFTATPSTIMVGNSTTLAWETSHATQVSLNNSIGVVSDDGSMEVSPTVNTVYKLTVIGEENKTVDCEVPVTVSEDPVPVCEFFTASPNALPAGGGEVTLDWKTLKSNTATITPTVGKVAVTGNQKINVTESTTFTLTAEDDNGDKVSCEAPVAVADPEPVLTCADDVTFTASDSSILRGSDTTLSWSTSNVDSVSISGINATALSGSQSVSPSTNTTYTLTATRGSQSVGCPVSVNVTTGGGGGGGSSSPVCELEISDKKIKRGDEITLTWDTNRATEVTLTDDRGNELFTTDDYLSKDKSDYYDGSIKVKPTRDTTYTLLAERSSRDTECEVKVEIEGEDVVVLQTRDQLPLVAGISLSQVPYTGFEAGPFMTLMFYALLVAWSLYITYMLVIRKRMTTSDGAVEINEVLYNEKKETMKKAEAVRPDAFVESTVPSRMRVATPVNLPTSNVLIGYDGQAQSTESDVYVNPHQVSDALVTALENRAHEQKALLSSDAVRHFVATTQGEVERNEALDEVIAEAKKNYPLEDGWIVINESRMRSLCEVCQVNSKSAVKAEVAFVPATVPEGSGSLAEAIVTGNVVAAYEMIGNRPMFALADAASDLDSVYRNRRGGNEIVSDMLTKETANLSDEKIKNMISALTSALDGTYTDEASAVKMAIMKAVKEAV